MVIHIEQTIKLENGIYTFTWYGLQHCDAIAGYNKKKNILIIAAAGTSREFTEFIIS